MLDSFGMNFDLTGAANDDEPGDAQNRPLWGFRKRWRQHLLLQLSLRKRFRTLSLEGIWKELPPMALRKFLVLGKTHSVSMTGLSRVGHIGVCPSLMRGVTVRTWYTTCTSSEWPLCSKFMLQRVWQLMQLSYMNLLPLEMIWNRQWG